MKAVYPGTFDPITHGHEDLIVRAARMFDEVIVAVAESTSKHPLFTSLERLNMVKYVLDEMQNVGITNVRAERFTGLLVTFTAQQRARVIVRGLRAVSDFEYEFAMAGMNRNLDRSIETIFLPTDERHMFTSSTMVREVARLHGNVARCVHPHVEAELLEKFP